MSDLLKKVEEHNPQLAMALRTSLEGMDNLLAQTEQDVAKISEAHFTRTLLPALVNRTGDQDLRVWQDIAGHAMRPIDVYDNATQKFLFRVPPLLKSFKTNSVTGRGRRSAFEIMNTAKQKSNVLPSMGDAHIARELTNTVGQGSIDPEEARAWDAILERYGYDPIFNLGKPKEEEQREEQSSGTLTEGFSGEYDDI